MANETYPGNITDGVLNITTTDTDKLNHEEVIKHLPILIFYVIILIVGIVGNLLVLIVYKFKLKRSSARVYIISLALADLLVCVVGVPYHYLDKIWILNYTNYKICKALTFLIVSGSFSSVFVLVVVGLDRFLKVCRPLKRQIRDFGDRKACLIAVGVAVLVSVPQLVLYGNSTYYRKSGIKEINCFIDDDYQGTLFAMIYLALYILIFIVSVVYLIIIYGFICRKIYEHDKMKGAIVLNKRKGFCNCTSGEPDDNDEELNEDQETKRGDENATEMVSLKTGEESKSNVGGDSTAKGTTDTKTDTKKKPLKGIPSSAMIRHTAGKKQEKNTRKITLMMFTITIVFIIAYLPTITIPILEETSDGYWDDMSDFTELLNDFLLRLYLINNVANPIIYCFWDKKFRKECVNILKRIFCCREDDNGGFKNTSSSSGSSTNEKTQYTLAK